MHLLENLIRRAARSREAVYIFAAAAVLSAPARAEENWPRFRGINGAGVSHSKQPLPTEISPATPLWKTEVAPGHSSPVLWKDRIFLTANRDKKLSTLALDRKTGRILWEAAAPYETLEKIHQTGSLSQSSPVTDGEVVVTFFGSSGLHAYDLDGKRLWSQRMGPFKNDFGAGSSPILVDHWVILVQDHDEGSFVAAYEKRSGKEVWRVDRPEALRSYATPIIWENAGRRDLVVSGTLRVVGYDLLSGRENWTVGGTSRIVNMTPVIGPDNTLYAACFSPGGEDADKIIPPTAEELFSKDANGNGTIDEEEFKYHPISRRFSQMDRNKDGQLTQEEYKTVRAALADGRNVVLAIKPGGSGDITKTHVKWEYTKQIPYCPSPLYYNDVLYLIKDGGILTSLDPATGKVIKQARLKASGKYYASPVGGDGKVYLLGETGDFTVISATGKWEELHQAAFDGDGHGTPIIADGKIYVRIGSQFYCFGNADQP